MCGGAFSWGTKGIFGMIAVVALIQVMVHRGGAGIDLEVPRLGNITLVTSSGLSMAGKVMARVGILISSTLVFNSAFDEGRFMESLSRLRVPFPIIFSLDLTLRLIPDMMEDVNEISKAYKMVYGDPKGGGPMVRWRRYLSLVRPLFLEYMRSAYQMGLSLELRGFKGKGKWPVSPYKPNWKDAGGVVILMVGVLMILTLAYAGRM